MNARHLLLASAAGVMCAGAAHAADLPVAPEPIDYVRVCDAFGPGYYFIPGTDTCLRVAGRIRADYNYFNFNEEFAQLYDAYGTSTRSTNAYRFRARAYIYMDSRTNTEFGLLRTFTEVYFTGDYGSGSLFDGEPNRGIGASESTVSTELNRAFIQFGGLTFGRTQSFFDFLDAYYTPGQFFAPDISDQATNVIAYTFAFGNGFSASIALEDEGYRRVQGFGSTPFATFDALGNPIAAGDVRYAGNRFPDIVGNLRIDQDWGTAQIMGAGHNVSVVQTATGFDAFGNPIGLPGTESEYGYAFGAGVNVRIPFGSNTAAGVTGGYSKGAIRYVSGDAAGGFAVADVGAANPINVTSSAGDYTILPDGSLDLTTAWNVTGGFTTSFTPLIAFAAQVGYSSYDQGEIGDVDGDGLEDSADFSNLDVQGYLSYAPVSGFELGVGAEWKLVDLDDDTYRNRPRGPIRTVDDPSGLSLFFRAERTF